MRPYARALAPLLLIGPLAAGHAAPLDTGRRAAACGLLETVRHAEHLPGLTAAVAWPDGSIVEFGVGRSAGDGAPMPPSAKFLSGSIGKTFVAMVLVDLYERGIVDLDAPLKNLFGSESWFRRLPNWDRVTLRELLTHSSGWPTHVESARFRRMASEREQRCPTCSISPREAISYIEGAKPLFPPGQGYFYSETNYLVAGLAIEKLTGRSYYAELEKVLLEPLGLEETVPSNTNEIPGLIAGAMTPGENYFGLPDSSTLKGGKLVYNPALEWTGGGLAATSADLVRWGRLLYTGRALPEPYLQDLFASVPTGTPNVRYGLAVEIRGRGRNVSYGHSGSIPGYRSVMGYFPASGLTVAAQFNIDPPDDDQDHFSPLVAAALRAAALEESAGGGFTAIRCD